MRDAKPKSVRKPSKKVKLAAEQKVKPAVKLAAEQKVKPAVKPVVEQKAWLVQERTTSA